MVYRRRRNRGAKRAKKPVKGLPAKTLKEESLVRKYLKRFGLALVGAGLGATVAARLNAPAIAQNMDYRSVSPRVYVRAKRSPVFDHGRVEEIFTPIATRSADFGAGYSLP